MCTIEDLDEFFKCMIEDNPDKGQKVRDIFMRNKERWYPDGNYDFDDIAIRCKLAMYHSYDNDASMLGKFGRVDYGCSECKCAQQVPIVSSEHLINEIHFALARPIVSSYTRKGLLGMLKIGIYQKIINEHIGYKYINILKQPPYIHLSKQTRSDLMPYLDKIAKQLHDPRYIVTSKYINNLCKKIPAIKEWSRGYESASVWTLHIDTNVNSIEEVEKSIDEIEELSADWFSYKTYKPSVMAFY